MSALDGLERLYGSHGGRMKGLAYRLLGNVSDAEDAVQEAFVKAYRGAGSFQEGAALSTWIYRILTNTCLDALRRRKKRQEVPAPEGPELQPRTPGDHPLRIFLEQAIARLDERHRAAFLLFEVEGFSHAEVATILEVSEPASRKLLFEAKRSLQKMLIASEPGETAS